MHFPGNFHSVITEELSAQLLRKYNDNKWTLAQLDNWRMVQFPHTLAKRYNDAGVYITRDELRLLMDWKLAKGKFRPALKKYIDSNDDDSVRKTTESGLAAFLDSLDLSKSDWSVDDVAHYKWCTDKAMKILCGLKGVGPATATLLLSLLTRLTPLAPPFFSDEAFLYFIQDPLYPGKPIKYTAKEYQQYCEVLYRVYLEHDNVPTIDFLEHAAWSLKYYLLHKLDTMVDIKPPKDIPEKFLDCFPDTNAFLGTSSSSSHTSTKSRS